MSVSAVALTNLTLSMGDIAPLQSCMSCVTSIRAMYLVWSILMPPLMSVIAAPR